MIDPERLAFYLSYKPKEKSLYIRNVFNLFSPNEKYSESKIGYDAIFGKIEDTSSLIIK